MTGERLTPVEADEMEVRAPGEVWQDSMGTLMVAETGGGWWVFGVEHPIPASAPTIAPPVSRVFDRNGDFVGDHLHYPHRRSTS